jgi:hypothetical protein
MFNPTRDQVRQFFCSTWQKHRAGHSLEGAEIGAGELCARHPEYHALLENPALALEQEWSPENGQMNPFLHLSLHLAIGEQVSINQPPGIREAFNVLSQTMSVHEAEHVILERLGETIWSAQRNGTPMDASAYINGVRRAAGLSNENP